MAGDTITLDTRNGLDGMVSDLAYIAGGDPSDLAVAGMLAKIAAEADQQLGMFVRSAVRGGATWQQVADSLGISRQAAHKRFSRP